MLSNQQKTQLANVQRTHIKLAMRTLHGFALVCLFLISGCSNLATHQSQNTPFVELSDSGDLLYHGEISFAGYELLLAKYQQALSKPNTLIIGSGGGDGLAGILIGRFIRQHKLKVYVPQICMSACANFIFTAGNEKRLGSQALIVFHGGFKQENLYQKFELYYQLALNKGSEHHYQDKNINSEATVKFTSDQQMQLQGKYFPEKIEACDIKTNKRQGISNAAQLTKRCIAFYREVESDFYRNLAIDNNIPYYGQQGKYLSKYRSQQYYGFYYTIVDLQAMGLTNIQAPKSQWLPHENKFFDKVYLAKPRTN